MRLTHVEAHCTAVRTLSLKTNFKIIAALGALAFVATAADAQGQRPANARAETTLVGISLYDSGLKVIQTYGSPLRVMALNVGAGAVGPAGGGGPGGAPGGAGGGASREQLGGASPVGGGRWQYGVTPGIFGDPFGEGRTVYFQDEMASGLSAGGQGTGAPGLPGGGGAPGGAPAGGGQASGNVVEFTRWVYHRGSSRYAFVLDNFSRVIQIEAIGLSDARVRTARGIRFGSNFDDVFKAYLDPDSYEISGDDMFVIRYLRRDNVAFRLTRVMANRPHCVTGIVVAAAAD